MTSASEHALATGQRVRRPSTTLAVVVASQLLVTMALASISISLPAIRVGLRLSLADASWLSNAYLLAFGGLLLLGGRTGDVAGKRRVLIIGMSLFALASLLGSIAPSFALLLVGLTAMGAGAALVEPATLALIATNTEEGAQRNRALGIFATASGLGLAGGLVLGGLLVTVSWRLALFVDVPAAAAIILAAGLFVDESPRHAAPFDTGGALTSTAGMATLVFALVRAATSGWTDRWTLATLVAGVILLAVCLAIELRADQPVLALHLLRDPSRVAAYANTALVATLTGILLFAIPQFLSTVVGLSPFVSGLAFAPLALTLFAAASLAGGLLTRWGPRPVLVVGVVLLLVGIGWLSRLSAGSGYLGGVLGPLLLIGAGNGLAVTALNAIILRAVPQHDTGAASGLQQATARLGGSVGLAAAVTVIGVLNRLGVVRPPAGAGAAARAHAVLTMDLAGAFGLATVFMVVALVVALVGIRSSPSEVHRSADPALRATP